MKSVNLETHIKNKMKKKKGWSKKEREKESLDVKEIKNVTEKETENVKGIEIAKEIEIG